MWGANMSNDSMGFTPTKPVPRLFNADLESYRPEVEWVKRIAAQLGYIVVSAVLDPYSAMWRFYEADGMFVVAVSEGEMDTLMEARLQGHIRDAMPIAEEIKMWTGEDDENPEPLP